MMEERVTIAELRENDLPFLFELWHTPEVMRYADEFPKLRGWCKSDQVQQAWHTYRSLRAERGSGYMQLMLGTPVRGGRVSAPMASYLEQVTSLEGKKVACLVTGVFPARWGRNQTISHMEEVCQATGARVCG